MKLKRIIALVTVFCLMFSCTAFAYLSEGSRGEEVKELQRNLNTLHNYGLEVDGIFGNATKNAVKDFQSRYGLEVDGIAGNATFGKINELLSLLYGRVLKKGCNGDDVKRLQSDLNYHNGSNLVVDGSFGSATKAAVEDFQRRHGLEVDGIVGPATQSKMKWCKDTGYTVTPPTGNRTGSTDRILDNVKNVDILYQMPGQCKAAALGQIINIFTGRNDKNERSYYDSRTDQANSIDNKSFTGSNGYTYIANYKTDSYSGSRAELESEIRRSLNDGLPIIAAVHGKYSNHHWVVIVGEDSNGYRIIDPANRSRRVVSWNDWEYDLGMLTNGNWCYGYVSFTRQ